MPSLGWTRPVALVFALLASAPSLRAIHDLLAYRDCNHQPAPDWALAGLVVLLALGLGAAGVKLQRVVARKIARRGPVRSRIGGAALASLAVLPALLLALANVGFALFVDFSATFQICFDFDPTKPFIPLGC